MSRLAPPSTIDHLIPAGDLVVHHIGDTVVRTDETSGWVTVPMQTVGITHVACVCGPSLEVAGAIGARRARFLHHPLDGREVPAL